MTNASIERTANDTLPAGPLALTWTTLGQRVAQADERALVDKILPHQAVGVFIGEPGIGKTPFLQSLGVCVASGESFLGYTTERGAIVYVDGESGQRQFHSQLTTLKNYHEVDGPLDSFHVWSPYWDSDYTAADPRPSIERLVQIYRPSLVVVDTLRSIFPGVERKTETATEFMQWARKIAHKYGTAFVFSHHCRKPDRNFPASLEYDIHAWFNEAAGSNAFITQSDVRLGLARPERANQNADVVLAGFVRGSGVVEPMYLAREYDEGDQVQGYQRLSGIGLLDTHIQEAYAGLTPSFSRHELRAAIGGNSDSNTARVLKLLEQCGAVRQATRGKYEKVTPK